VALAYIYREEEWIWDDFLNTAVKNVTERLEEVDLPKEDYMYPWVTYHEGIWSD
jgi:hypothetical protein